MKFTILGSGFGLYGYLPALIHSGQKIVLPHRYQARFNLRNELTQFVKHITWQSDEMDALKRVEGVVLALNPDQQTHWLPICLKEKKVKKILLEKPLASSPAEAERLLKHLYKSNVQFRISYLFRYTGWGQLLLAQLKKDASINEMTIEWRFKAHHFQHNIDTWKRTHAQGGGAIRFYGIHLIAFLAELGYDNVISSKVVKADNEYIKWEATFVGKNFPQCHVIVDTQSPINLFNISQTSHANLKMLPIVHLSEPFQKNEGTTLLDKRIPFLVNVCQSLLDSTENYFDWYFSAIELWKEVEKNLN